MISWLSFGVTTGERSFFGTSSMIALISTFSDTPFCRTFSFSVVVVFPTVEALPEIFDVAAVFLVIGDGVGVVFVVMDKRFAVVAVALEVETRVVLVAELDRAMEICLLAVSLTCLSMIGDLAVAERRDLAVVPVVGAVLGLVLDAVVVVVDAVLDFAVVLLTLVAVVVDDRVVFFVVVVPVNVRAVVVFANEDLVADVVLLVGGLAAAVGLFRDFTSPFAVGFLSPGRVFVTVVAGFGFAARPPPPRLILFADFVTVLLVVAVFEDGLAAAVGLLDVVLDTVVFFAVSRSFGRAVVVVVGFFAVVVDVLVVEDTVFDGDVGVDFCAFLVAVIFVDFAAGLAFVLF